MRRLCVTTAAGAAMSAMGSISAAGAVNDGGGGSTRSPNVNSYDSTSTDNVADNAALRGGLLDASA